MEAWYVDKKGNIRPSNDSFWIPGKDKTCGTVTISGQMVFVEEGRVKLIAKKARIKLPIFKGPTMVSNNFTCGEIDTGPYNSEHLSLWEEFKKFAESKGRIAAYHEMQREWQCCCEKRDKYSWYSNPNSKGTSEQGGSK